MDPIRIAFVTALGSGVLAMPALADFDELAGSAPTCPNLVTPRITQELKSSATRPRTSTHVPNDTTWVGFNPAYAGSNYWSIGVGHRRPPGKSVSIPDGDTGYWDWDHPVHGDSLQGWWPVRHTYQSFFIANLNDKLRPWHAIDMGNSISYVINQGPGYRRTYGVTGAWHPDPGVTAKTADPGHGDVNPNPPRWTPLAGSMSAWCGLRAHGDVTAIDALTGNPYNSDALEQITLGSPTVPVGPGWTNYRFPGYVDQWDQMLYRDVDISGASGSANVSVSFRYRTRMSTGKGINPTSRTGWFDKDPLTVNAGNFISSTDAGNGAPIDSFMVYVGAPVADTAGAQWTGSDGNAHQVFDPVRRWFGELIRANEANGHYELYTTYGNDPPISAPADSNAYRDVVATRNVTYGALRAAWGNRVRLVFRIKTNRGWETPSSDAMGSQFTGAYNSGYLGAAQLDNVAIDLGSGATPLGGFESAGDIDNNPGASALDAWKTSSKPPAVYFHVHSLSDLNYQDLCGPPGSNNRICDMIGNVISMGDHDHDENAVGPIGTAEQEPISGVFSPTINLCYDHGDPTAKNNMGLDADTAAGAAADGDVRRRLQHVYRLLQRVLRGSVLAGDLPVVPGHTDGRDPDLGRPAPVPVRELQPGQAVLRRPLGGVGIRPGGDHQPRRRARLDPDRPPQGQPVLALQHHDRMRRHGGRLPRQHLARHHRRGHAAAHRVSLGVLERHLPCQRDLGAAGYRGLRHHLRTDQDRAQHRAVHGRSHPLRRARRHHRRPRTR
jgi:hypothetical protein